jgi:small subunit ribosomal protein S7
MRTSKAKVREIKPDVRFDSTLVARLINRSIRDGKKSVAQNQIYKALDLVAEQTKKKPLDILERAINNISPQMEVRSRRVGGASYQVPMPVRGRRGYSLSIRWIVKEANKRPNKQYHSYAEKIAAELIEAAENKGGAVEKKNSSHRMAESNKAFSHFRW